MGGAGYSAWSGLPSIIETFSPVITFEGDNTVMAQQSARYLMKLYQKVKQGETVSGPEGIFSYLNKLGSLESMKCKATNVEDF